MRQKHLNGIRHHLANGEERLINRGLTELIGRRSDGSEFPAEISVGRASGATGPIFIGFLRDISARKQAVADVAEALRHAEAADRAKSEFLAVISHEMRTPLNGVLGMLDLMRSTKLDARQLKYIDIASQSAELLLRHVDDVLDATMIERGALRLETLAFELDRLVEEVAEIGRPGAEANGNTIELALSGPTGQLIGDPHRLRQVLLNLLTNASKFATDGRITLAIDLVSETATKAEVEISVTDTGIGIAEDQHQRIFEDFTTVNPSYDRVYGGVGLGLSICRRIVRRMGGEISVTSNLGAGSRFSVHLQLAKAPANGVPSARAIASEGSHRAVPMRVLVVDDNDINRLVTIDMLTGEGHTAIGARDGLDAVARADEECFDLILMDISMPRMDGIQATRAIRKGGGRSQNAPIFALTAHAMENDARALKAAGIEHCLYKPLRLNALHAALGLVAPDGGTAGDDAGSPEPIDADVFDALAEVLDDSSFRAALERFLADIDDTLPKIAAAVDARDAAALGSAAHKLLGAASLIGATQLATTLRAVETAARADRLDQALTGEIPARADAVRAILREVIAAMPNS